MATLEQLYGHFKTLIKQWFYDKEEIDTLLDEKIDEVELPTNTSDLTNDGSDGVHPFLTQHQDISGKANSSDLSSVATSGSYLDLDNIPLTFAPSTHSHTALEVTDATAYTHIGTSANSTQSSINSAIDSRLGSLLSVELITVVDSLPSASANTMNKLYLVAEDTAEPNDAYEIYLTVEDEGSYSWEKVDTARLELTGYAPLNHVHGNITTDGKVGNNSNYFVYTTTNGTVTSKEMIGNITVDGTIGNTSGQVVTTTTNGVLQTSDWVTEVDNIVLQLTNYGITLNGATVTINLKVYDDRSGFTHGMGLFLFDTETTYANFNDLRANVDYSDFIPLEPNETTVYATSDFEHQFVFNNVAPGEYYVVLCDYDENNLPILRQGSSNNLLAYINEDVEDIYDTYSTAMPYDDGNVTKLIIEVVANGTNVWYGLTDN